MLGAREVTEILRIYQECGIETKIGHYGDLDGTNKFFDVDVWLRLGDNFPNLSFVRYLSHALECEGRLDADGDIFTSMTEQNDVQDRGRARPKERSRKTPLLEIKCGSRVDGYPEIIETVGHPPTLFSHLCQIVAQAFITCYGWRSAPVDIRVPGIHREWLCRRVVRVFPESIPLFDRADCKAALSS